LESCNDFGDSSGHVLDPNTGFIYPFDGIDTYDYDLSLYVDEIDWESVSKEDRNTIDKYWISTEKYIQVDFDLLQDLKDLSLDYLDEGLTLWYEVMISLKPGPSQSGRGSRQKYLKVAQGEFDHTQDKFEYSRYFLDDMQIVKDKYIPGELVYYFLLKTSRFDVTGNMVKRGMSDKLLKSIKDISGYPYIITPEQ
jgi:hypothetical protein